MNAASMHIEFARPEDIQEVMDFVREHWSPQHVLGHSRALIEWQHASVDRFNFVVARTDASGVVGILGFIPLSRFDSSLAAQRLDTIWLTTWKVRSELARGAGLRLLVFLQKAFPGSVIGTVGLNPATRSIYMALGYRTGVLTRFALVRPGLVNPTLAILPEEWKAPLEVSGLTKTRLLDHDAFLSDTEGLGLDRSRTFPNKTRKYILQRYIRHPFYQYNIWLLNCHDLHGILVTRSCHHDGASAVRVVDFLGDSGVLAEAGPALASIIGDAEYLDFYAFGLDEELGMAGLVDVAAVPGLILPGHFEPFDARNVDLLFSLRASRDGRMLIFKGDADQDRPNRLLV